MLPNIVSADDHVVEHPTLWQDRLPAADRERGPRVVREKVAVSASHGSRDAAEWCDIWTYENERVPLIRSYASVGYAPEDVRDVPTTYEQMRPGCYELEPRLSDMDANGVDASLCFPNLFVRFCGQRFLWADDKDLALRCVQAYNDWLIDEWQDPSRGRIVGATIIPLWDVEAAAAEIFRNAARGGRAVTFSEIPPYLDLPSVYSGAWEPFFAACNETETVVCIHIGSASKLLTSSEDAPSSVGISNDYIKSSLSVTDWLIAGIFERYPKLKVSYAEAQAGWMPYIVERLDWMWQQGNARNEMRERLPRPPSTYFREHVYSCIFYDPVAIALIDRIGSERICFETDYPHPDTTWPNSKQIAQEHLAGLSPDVVHKIIRGNAIELFRLDESKLAWRAASA